MFGCRDAGEGGGGGGRCVGDLDAGEGADGCLGYWRREAWAAERAGLEADEPIGIDYALYFVLVFRKLFSAG